MAQKITFRIGLNGNIEPGQFELEHVAAHEARKLWENSPGRDDVANVYGECEYSEDDPTPVHARTTFWKHKYLDVCGRWKNT